MHEANAAAAAIEAKPGRYNKQDSWLYDFTADTAGQAIAASRLDWEVELRELHYRDGGGTDRPVSGRLAVVQRNGSLAGSVHGVVSSRYAPIQNAEAAKAVDPILATGGFRATQGGFTSRGRCWLMLDSTRVDDVTGKGDEVTHHLLVHWRHDGGTSVRADFVSRRVVCANAIQGLVDGARGRKAGAVFNIHHHRDYA